MSFDASTIAMLKTGIWETVYMTMLSSFLAYVIGLPLGVILVVTDEGRILSDSMASEDFGIGDQPAPLSSISDSVIYCASAF